jgi:DNA-directed RNA polymerase specialized sigma24 family protein
MRGLIAVLHSPSASPSRGSGPVRALGAVARAWSVRWRLRVGRPAVAEGAIGQAYEVALRLTGDAAEAEALVERALDVQAARRRTRGDETRAAFWLFDALYATHRAARGSVVREEAGGEEVALPTPEPPLPGTRPVLEDVGRLRAALDALPGGLWHPLWLRDRHGFDYQDIGLLLDVPAARVARLVSEARRRVMGSLRRPAPGPEASVAHDRPDSRRTLDDGRSGSRGRP